MKIYLLGIRAFILILSIFLMVYVTAYTRDKKLSPSQKPQELKGLEIEEKPGDFIDTQLVFIDEEGKKVKLEKFFKEGKPVLLSIIYYNCPNLCSLHLNGLFEALMDLPRDFHKDFQLVLVSMDSKEKSNLALEKKENYLEQYPLPIEQVHFLTGAEKNIKKLSSQVGFKFRWDEKQQLFAHLPVAYILTPKAKIAQYLYGVLFKAQTIRLSLVEASQGKIGSIIDRVLLFCFQFDPKKGQYSWYAYNIMRVGGLITICMLCFFLIGLWRKEKDQKGVS